MERIFGNIGKDDEGPFRSVRTDDEGNLCTVPSYAGLPYQFFLTADGLQSTSHDLIGDYSVTSDDFYYTATTRYDIYTVLISISDNANFNLGDYGAIASGLTNGVKFYIKLEDGVTELPLLGTGFNPIKTNGDWFTLTPDCLLTTFAGLSQSLTIDINLVKQYGKPLSLDPGQTFLIRLNDNFSTLVHHTFGLRGTKF